jgi:hypothetical protein
MKPKLSLRESIAANNVEYMAQYLDPLTWSLQCIRYLLRQGLSFHGHTEGNDSNNKGKFSRAFCSGLQGASKKLIRWF